MNTKTLAECFNWYIQRTDDYEWDEKVEVDRILAPLLLEYGVHVAEDNVVDVSFQNNIVLVHYWFKGSPFELDFIQISKDVIYAADPIRAAKLDRARQQLSKQREWLARHQWEAQNAERNIKSCQQDILELEKTIEELCTG